MLLDVLMSISETVVNDLDDDMAVYVTTYNFTLSPANALCIIV